MCRWGDGELKGYDQRVRKRDKLTLTNRSPEGKQRETEEFEGVSLLQFTPGLSATTAT
jgi:hypothetical protein